MVIRARDDGQLLLWAVAASLCAHLILALFLPIWTTPQSGELQPVQALSFARVLRVQLAHPAPAAQPVAVPDTHHIANHVAFARHRSELTAKSHSPHVTPTAVNGPSGRYAAAPRHVALARAAPLFARVPAPSASVNSTQTVAARAPNPDVSLAPRPVQGAGGADRGGVLPLGASQDPVVDPVVLSQLQKRVGVHVTLLVTVGEDGHTKHVAFQPDLDPQLEREIESILADANWDAAVCGGGVTCEGVATIKL